MLKNSPRKPVEHDRDRRWIADDDFDLIVWYEPDGAIHGFQLCDDKPGRERALTWTPERGFLHTAIDSGESHPTANRSPSLVPDGSFPAQDVRREFLTRGAPLPDEIRELVLRRIAEYAARQPSA